MASTKIKPKQVEYLNKDFNAFKSTLVEYAKTYFPQSYADFNETSPGMMFIEMASYVGDVLAFHIDEQFRESLLVYAEERKTIYDIAQSYGYKPTVTTPSTVKLDFFQTVPATGTGNDIKPDYRYAYEISAGSRAKSDEFGVSFRTTDNLDFKVSSSLDPTTVSIYEVDSDNLPTKFLLKKCVRAVSGDIAEERFTFTTAKAYDQVVLEKDNVLEVISCTDSDQNKWYEVESLAQDLVFDDVANTADFDSQLSQYNDTVPYILKMVRSQQRFKTRLRDDNKTMIQFGSGTSTQADEEIVPNPSTVGNTFTNTNFLNTNSALDPANFLDTAVYGKAPANTTLTFEYSYGGGINDNVPSNSITSANGLTLVLNTLGLNAGLVNESRGSIAVNNEVAATGGRGAETLNEIKENARQYFHAQMRSVSKQDYITRVYNMPSKYGNISKIYITQDDQLNAGEGVLQDQVINQDVLDANDGEIQLSKLQVRVPNPNALNMYVLGYDGSKKLATVNEATKRNIKTYLGPYRILTDAVNIKDAFIINIGVRFSILTKKGYNKEKVILNCIQKLKEYFDIDKWQINQPIILTDVAYELSLVEGVNNIVPPKENNPDGHIVVIENKFKSGDGYSGNIYDINDAISDGTLYPSLDPSVFEVKFPDTDITGRVLGDY